MPRYVRPPSPIRRFYTAGSFSLWHLPPLAAEARATSSIVPSIVPQPFRVFSSFAFVVLRRVQSRSWLARRVRGSREGTSKLTSNLRSRLPRSLLAARQSAFPRRTDDYAFSSFSSIHHVHTLSRILRCARRAASVYLFAFPMKPRFVLYAVSSPRGLAKRGNARNTISRANPMTRARDERRIAPRPRQKRPS